MNKDYVLNFAKELLHIDSPSGYTKAAIDFVEKEVTALGYENKAVKKPLVFVPIVIRWDLWYALLNQMVILH